MKEHLLGMLVGAVLSLSALVPLAAKTYALKDDYQSMKKVAINAVASYERSAKEHAALIGSCQAGFASCNGALGTCIAALEESLKPRPPAPAVPPRPNTKIKTKIKPKKSK